MDSFLSEINQIHEISNVRHTFWTYFLDILFGQAGRFGTVVVVYINSIKTILEFNFDLYHAFKQHG